MDFSALLTRLDFVVYGENSWRLQAKAGIHGNPEITYDAHGQTVLEARRTIRNIVNISRIPIDLYVIHGFNHGTAIKDMLAMEDFSGRLETRYCPQDNPGETILSIAA